jgi:hypothetical protein
VFGNTLMSFHFDPIKNNFFWLRKEKVMKSVVKGIARRKTADKKSNCRKSYNIWLRAAF